MDKDKLAGDLTRLLFDEDDAALRDFFIKWKQEAPSAKAAQVMASFESRILELRAAIHTPGAGSPSRGEIESALRLMFLLISQGGSSVG